MKSTPSKLHGVTLTEQDVHHDERGWSCQPFSLVHHNFWQNRNGVAMHTYMASSVQNTFRGMHWQQPNPQVKFVHVVHGVVYAYVIDIRLESPTFGEVDTFRLDFKNTLYVPHGFALGYHVHHPAVVSYFIHGDRDAKTARTLRIHDSLDGLIVSENDRNAPKLADIPKEWLFPYHGVDTR